MLVLVKDNKIVNFCNPDFHIDAWQSDLQIVIYVKSDNFEEYSNTDLKAENCLERHHEKISSSTLQSDYHSSESSFARLPSAKASSFVFFVFPVFHIQWP